LALCSLSALVALLVVSSAASAATIPVTTTADATTTDGQCSLREAISTVNDPAGMGNGDCTPATTGGANTITLGAQTYKFANGGAGEDANAGGDLDIAGTTTSLTISGAGAGSTVVDANHVDRVFDIHSGPAVTFDGVTITNGNAPNGSGAGSGGSPGGGILTTTALTLIDSAVTNNKAGNGATVSSNPGNTGGSGGNGGGINATAALTLTNTTISGNFAGNGGTGGTGSPSNTTGGAGGSGGAAGQGGGLFLFGSPLTITGSTFSGNHGGNGGNGGKGGLGTNGTGAGGSGGGAASGAPGGGLVALGSASTVLISRSTFTGNVAGTGGKGGDGDDGTGSNGGSGGVGGPGGGGGAIGAAGSLTITNSTLTGNTAGSGGAGGNGGNGNGVGNGGNGGNGGSGGQGGALITNLSTAGSLTNLTLAANAKGAGGNAGVHGAGNADGTDGSAGSAGTFDHIRVIGANGVALANSITTGGSGAPCSTGVSDGGHNVVTDNCAGIASVGDPKLGPLTNNGGAAATMALQSGSAAIDAVPASGANCPTTDERGTARPSGAACDAGAYEFAPPVAVTNAADGVGDSAATLHGTVTPNTGDAQVRFEYGTSTAYGTQTDVQHLSGFAGQAASAGITGLTPGTTYHFRVIATNADGSVSGDDQTFTTTGTAPGGGANTPGGGGSQNPAGTPAGSELAAVTGLSFAPRTFRAAPKGPPATAAKARIGSKVSFTLNMAASVRFTVQKQLPGRRGKGGRCVKPTRSNRKARKCTRLVARGSFTRTGAGGTNSFRFSGRLRGKKLAPGRYRMVALPTAGGKSGKKASAAFRIVR
jgi:CSLREA domain-containing protein